MNTASPARRGLLYFLLLSLALHLVVLLGPKRPKRMRLDLFSPAPLTAVLADKNRLRQSAVPAAGQAATQKPTSHPPARSAASRLASTEPARPNASGRNPAVPPPALEAGSERAVPTLAPEDKVDLQDVREYVLLLVPEARKRKRYPPQASERGWAGTAEITVRLSRETPGPSVALGRSSGYPVLDEEALAIVGQAARATAVPEGLRGKAVTIPVPVRFSLDD